MFAEIITIGDEILIGQIVDTNSAWIARELNKIGIWVKQVSSVSDERAHILKAIAEAETRADIIIMTGGLGPTKDDITKQTLAAYFGSHLVMNEEALANVRRIFAAYRHPVLEVNVKQAEVPDNCTVIQNLNGTAPGMYFQKGGKQFFSLPGVPFEMMAMMEVQIIPILLENPALPHIVHETILTAGIGESFLAERIADIEDALPAHIKLAYLPKLGQVRLRLSGSGSDRPELEALLAEFKSKIAERVADYVIALEDIPLEQAILQKLEEKGKTLSTAESCTGGYIGHLLTSIPGSSKSYMGGAISYSYELKEQMLGVSPEILTTYGAVSEETVREMVKGCLSHYGSDYAIACSGIAGPGGGTEDKPVGTVWIGVGNASGIKTHKFVFGNKRMQNIERTAVNALYMLHKLMNE